MSLQHANRTRVIMRPQSNEDEDIIQSDINGASAASPQDIIYQQVKSLEMGPELLNDTPDRIHYSMSGPQNTAVRQRMGVEAEMPLTMGRAASDGAAGGDDAPAYAPLLKAANLSEDTSGASTAIYTPKTGRVIPGATIYKYIRNVENGNERLRFTHDVLGSIEFSMSASEEATFSFSGQGFFVETGGEHFPEDDFIDDSDGQLQALKDGSTTVSNGDNVKDAVSGSLASKNPVYPKNMTVTIDGNTYHIGEVTLSLNLSTDPLQVMTAAEGKTKHLNTKGTSDVVEGGFDLLESTASNFDNLLTDYTTANIPKMVFTLKDIRTGTPEEVKFEVFNCQLLAPEEGDNGNLASHQFNFRAARDLTSLDGDNDFKITYTT